MLRKIIRKGGKFFLWSIGLVVLLIIILFIFVQTDTFNKYLLEYTLDQLNPSISQKDYKINAESLEGNLLNGIKLNQGSLTLKEDTLLAFKYLEVKYDLWGLIDKRITVKELILNEPVISLSQIRSGDSLIWNYEDLFPAGEPDTVGSPFDWDISCEMLRIENGFIRIAGDSLKPAARWMEKRAFIQSFDLMHTDVSDLNLELSAKYYKEFKSVSIKNISFNTNSELNVKKFRFDANLNEKDTVIQLWNFELLTNRSDIRIYRLFAEKLNPLLGVVYEEFGNKNIDASIDIQKFNFDDLTFFLPEIDFLDSTVSVKLDAKGRYGDLYAETIRVQLPNSDINLKGRVVNLQNPDSLYFDVQGYGLAIYTPDVKTIYLGDIPDYSHLGMVNADINYKGTYRSFYSDFVINTSAGFAEGMINFDIPNEVYSGYVNTRALNPGRIIKDNSLNGNLNLTAKFDGRGFEPGKMQANLVYSVMGSRFGGYDIRRSAGTINANRGSIKLNINHASSMGSANVKGSVNISNMKNPSYDLKGKVSRLDISGITKSADDKSDLNFSFDINGRGISPEDINGKYNFEVAESQYGKYHIPETPIDAEITSINSNGNVKVSTDMFDLNAEGNFKINSLLQVIMFNVDKAQEQFVSNTGTANLIGDSSINLDNDLDNSKEYNNAEDLNFTYRLVTKDSLKLQKILMPFGVQFSGNVSGDINNTSGKFTSATKLDVKDFTYRDTAIVLKNLKTDFVFSNEYTNSLTGINLKLNTQADRISSGSTVVDSITANVDMKNQQADISVKGGMDSTAKVSLGGKLDFAAGDIDADLDSVHMKYAGYEIRNSDNWKFSFEQGENIRFEQMNVKSRNAILKISGNFSLNNESDLRVEGSNIKITDIAEIINQADTSYVVSSEKGLEGELTTLTINYKGTFENPKLTSDIRSNTLVYHDTKIGVFSSKIDYQDGVATADVKMDNADKKGSLQLKGTIPFKNPLSNDTITAPYVSTAPVDINLKANNFVLDHFSVLISDIASLRGVLNADLLAKGTVSDPALSGNLKIDDGGYLLPLTGMYHNFDMAVSTDNFKLVLDKLRLYNEEDEERHMDLTGSLDFKDLKLKDINIEARGELVILDKDVEQNELGVYGYILTGTGNPPLKIQGSMDSLYVTGQLLIKDATISSVPLEGSGYNGSEDKFIYIEGGNDSARVNPDSLMIATMEQYNLLNPFERLRYVVPEESKRQSSVNLDLNVKTEKSIYASIDFNNLTRDRLFGELKADLDIKTVDGKLLAFGTVDVAGDSYYRFYRDFKLNESQIKFDGDISDPELNIKGVYASQKSTEQYGSVTTNEVEVIITVKGKINNPELTLMLFQDGSEVSGSDAQSDAITYLLFGRYKSELTGSERTAVASTLGASVGSLYASSYLSQMVREILPFIVDAQFTYTEGSVQDTDVELISELGEARVKFGGKLLKDVKNFELTVDYPLNRLLNLNLPETLLLEFVREEKKQTLSTNPNDIITTEIKILYKIKF